MSFVQQQISAASGLSREQAQAPSIEVTSRESRSTVVAPDRSLSKKVASFFARKSAVSRQVNSPPTCIATTPSMSPTSQSPLFIATPPRTTGLAIEPGPDFVEPRNAMPLAKTGNRCRSMAATSRTVPSITRATTPATSAAVVSTSPKYPRGVLSPNAIARTDPRGARVTAACNARLSPGAQNAVKAGPAKLAPGHIGRIPELMGTAPDSASVAAPRAMSCCTRSSVPGVCLSSVRISRSYLCGGARVRTTTGQGGQ